MANHLQRTGSILVLTAGAATLAIPDSNLRLPFGENLTIKNGTLPSLTCHMGQLSILSVPDDPSLVMTYHLPLEGSAPGSDNSLVITHGRNGYDYGLVGHSREWSLSRSHVGQQTLVAAKITSPQGDYWSFTPRPTSTGNELTVTTECN